jgi:hypothetical protein
MITVLPTVKLVQLNVNIVLMPPLAHVVNKTSSYLVLLVLLLVHLDNGLNNISPMEIVPTFVLIVTILV